MIKAVGYTRMLPVTDPDCLLDLEIAEPSFKAKDLLVRVKAISVNPIDTKQRKRKAPEGGQAVILGWDVAGVVEKVGSDVSGFRLGDEVYYAGDITRAGGNSELHAIDERLVARKPRDFSFAQAAAIPLTALTAYEALFDQFGISPTKIDDGSKALLILGGAGGVGSMAVQMGKLAGLRVVATASRPETIAWVKEMGADDVLDHREALAPQLERAGLREVDYIFNTANTLGYWDQMAQLIKPFGKICSIVESPEPVDLSKLMMKSATFSWELMFTRSMFQTPDQSRQGEILQQVTTWLEEGKLQGTLTKELSPINAKNLIAAHALIESGKGRGKTVLSNW